VNVKKWKVFKFIALFLCLASTSALIVACGQNTPTATVLQNTPENTQVIFESGLRVVIPTYYELANRSDIVILGQVLSEVGILNGARDYPDISKPDPRLFYIQPVYKVKVEKFLMGNGTNIVNIARSEGFIEDSGTPSPESIEDARAMAKNKEYVPFELSKRYLMFLTEGSIWEGRNTINELKQGIVYSFAGFPGYFDASDVERVSVVAPENEMYMFFPPQSLDEIVEQMTNPDLRPPTPAGIPYPDPLVGPQAITPSSNVSSSDIVTPYPDP
jgi:hypothetical protein